MLKKLDALLMRKTFRADKFKATMVLTISRLAVIKNQRKARCSIARSDVVEFLNINNHQRALHRVELVIKDQNMLDVLVLLEGYCHLFLERVSLIEHEKVCPEELQEAASSLIYASTRCGDFPELQEIRAIFSLRFGRDFVARAAELRNNCGVNPKAIQKLSTRMPSLEDKMEMLKEIASNNNIVVHVPVDYTASSDTNMIHNFVHHSLHEFKDSGPLGFAHQEEILSSHSNDDGIETPTRQKYKDVAEAAQAAFESAAYAAAAARAAFELSRSGPRGPTNGDDPYALRKHKGDGETVFDGSDDDGEGVKRVDENDNDSQFDAEEIGEIEEPLNNNSRLISVGAMRAR